MTGPPVVAPGRQTPNEMSLHTDSIFIAAIKADDTLMGTIGNRLYGTAIPMPDEDADNTPVPYIIVTFDGLVNDQDTKDNPYEGELDNVTIGVEIVAQTLSALHQLSQQVRRAIYSYFNTNEDTGILDYQFSAGVIQYDSLKPCYWHTFSYRCSVVNPIIEENGEDQE